MELTRGDRMLVDFLRKFTEAAEVRCGKALERSLGPLAESLKRGKLVPLSLENVAFDEDFDLSDAKEAIKELDYAHMRGRRGVKLRPGVQQAACGPRRNSMSMSIDYSQVTPIFNNNNFDDALGESRKKLKRADSPESPKIITPRVLDMSSPSPSADNRMLLDSPVQVASFDDDKMSVDSKVFTDHTSLGSCANAFVGNPGATPAPKRGNNLTGKATRQLQRSPDDFYSTDIPSAAQQPLQHLITGPTAAHVRKLEGQTSASSCSSVATIHREESFHKALSTVVESTNGSHSTDGVRVAVDATLPQQLQKHDSKPLQQQQPQQQQPHNVEQGQQQKRGFDGAALAEAPTQAAASDRNLQRKITGESHKATAERSLKRAITADSCASNERQIRAATTANVRKGQSAVKTTDSNASSPRNMMRNPGVKQRTKDTTGLKAPNPQWNDVYDRLQPNPTGQKNVSTAAKALSSTAEPLGSKSAQNHDAASKFASRHFADPHAALQESSAPIMRMDGRAMAECANHLVLKETSAPLATTAARPGDGHPVPSGGDLNTKRTPRTAATHGRPPPVTASSSSRPARATTPADNSGESRTAPRGEDSHAPSKENVVVRNQDTSVPSEANAEPSIKAPETAPERKANRYNLVRSNVKTLVTQEHNIKGGVALHVDKLKAQVEKTGKTATEAIPSTSAGKATSASTKEGEQKPPSDARHVATPGKLRPVVPTFSPEPRPPHEKVRPKRTITQMREERRKVPKLPDENYELSPRIDSDQEEKQMKTRLAKKVPGWTRNFESIATSQQDIDPDTIFAHKLPAVNLELVFGKKLQRKRTSSVVWDHDQLTREEISRYKADMNQDQEVSPRESWHPRDGKSGLKHVFK